MLKKYTLLLITIISFNVSAQSVTTVTEGAFTDALALDSQGNLYCSDWGGKTVYKYSTSGVVSVFKNGFSNPNGIGINASDEIYICDHTDNKIFKYDVNGNLTQEYTGLFVTPAGIKNIPNTNEMLVVEYGTEYSATKTITNSKIKKITAEGTVTTLHTGLPLNGPAGITYVNDIAYIANFNDRKIFKFENNILTEIAQLPSEGTLWRNSLGFLSSIDNQLIASHIGGHKIYKIDPISGAISVFAGSSIGNVDGNLDTALLDSPNGIIGDTANKRIYISQGSQGFNKHLRIIDGVVLSSENFNFPKFKINVYSNPNKDSLNIQITDLKTDSIDLKIYDINGRQVLQKEFKNEGNEFKSEIKTSSWAKGTYILKVNDGKQIISKKIIL
jgi:glutamine cyclotransferase